MDEKPKQRGIIEVPEGATVVVERASKILARVSLVLAVLAAVLVSSPSWALAQSSYSYTSLGNFSPFRISESGQIVGAADYARGPALIWQDGVVTEIGDGVAQAINGAG